MTLSPSAKVELQWWADNIINADNDIFHSDPELVVTSDASSKIGWGCSLPSQNSKSGGHWLPVEKCFQINYLELKAALFALQCYRDHVRGKHVRIMIDNTTAVSCINHMGTSHSPSCNAMAQIIWQWCLDYDVWLSSAFIPGAENTAADEESRRTNTDAEWMLDTGALQEAFSCLNMRPVIDLFASRLNKQMTHYVSFRPDPEAEAVDAFSLSWSDVDWYAFPPFSVIGRTLAKVQREKS